MLENKKGKNKKEKNEVHQQKQEDVRERQSFAHGETADNRDVWGGGGNETLKLVTEQQKHVAETAWEGPPVMLHTTPSY